MWKNHFDVYVILHHSLRNGLVWTGKRRTFNTWTIVKFELFKTNRLTFGIRNSGSEETHFLPTSFLDLIKLYFGFWGMRISQKLERTEFLFVIFLIICSLWSVRTFSVNAPLSICEQFIDKKKTMVTYDNFFYQILLCISIFKAEFTHNWAR